MLKSAVSLLLLAALVGVDSRTSQAHENNSGKKSYPTFKKLDNGVQYGKDAPKTQGDATPVGEGKSEKTDGEKRSADTRRAERNAKSQAEAEARRAIFLTRIREMISKAGFPEAATQDAIIAHIASEEKSKSALRESTRRLAGAIRRDAPPERVRDLLAEYKVAAEAEKLRKETARAALDAQIGYTKNPRLEAILLISGILGDGNGFRLDMMMQRQGGYGPQNGMPRGGTTGNRERIERERPAENREGGVEAPAPEIKIEVPAQPEAN